MFGPPVRGDQDQVGLSPQPVDPVDQPVGYPLLQRGVGHAGMPRCRGEVRRVVGDAQHPDAQPGAGQHHRVAGLLHVPSRADGGDSRVVQVGEGVEQRGVPEVQGVVVRQRHAVHSEPGQGLGGGGRCAEEERLGRIGPRAAPGGDTTLQVEHEQVRSPGDPPDLGCNQVQWSGPAYPGGHTTTQHHVTGQGQGDGHDDRLRRAV